MKRNPAEVPARPSRCVYQLTSHESPVRTNQSPSHPYTTNGRHRYCRCTCRRDYRSSTRAVNRIAIMIYLRLVYHHRVHLAVEAASLKTLLAVASRLLPLDGRRRLRKAAVVAISKCRLSRTLSISLPVEMLSNLASYLMGGGSAVPAAAAAAAVGGPSPTPSTVPTEVAQGTVIALQELRCTEEEDWLLVDPDAISSNNWSGHSGRCSKGIANGCFSGSIVMEGEVPSGSQRGTAPISIKRRSGSRCWLSFNETKGDVARNEVDHADDDQGGANRITGQNRSRSRDNCDSSSNISGSGQGGHQMEQRGCSGSGGNSESGEGGNPKGSEDDSENCAPSSGLEESWYVAPSACIARRRPVKLATSPLENLLIEHPSMSVYHHSLLEDAMQSPSISSSPVTIEKADEDDEPSVDEEMVEMVGQMRPCGGKRARQRSRRKQDFFVPYTVTPTIPHLKSQKTIR
ncbi:uncharacterized protein LOC111251079 isoform X2 [Varroa destructor]|uniref:Uncharacterized protein n=1 Tax=Varroa destructor TaxID=109461 RepID=A0A7M7KG69_VARDE|nr:uncharacterized protein LOC111251079 isoform X2 [Varroa destructor]